MPISPPACVITVAAGRRIAVVWRNELGGIVFELSGSTDDRWFVKWAPAASGIDLDREYKCIEWASRFVAVPRLLGHGKDADGSWIVTRALSGSSAVAERWVAAPGIAAAAIGAGLRTFHDSLPVDDCPFTWSIADRLADIRRRAAVGMIRPERWHSIHQHLSVDDAVALLADPPSIDRLVVCHGDTCAPNTIIGDDGRCMGHVDLGALGVADRWADLAIATWSTQWNYGLGWEDVVLDAYGVARDEARMRYYRLLFDLGP